MFKRRFPYLKQPDSMECGATCLRMVARYYGKLYSAEAMRRLCVPGHNGGSMQSLNEAAQKSRTARAMAIATGVILAVTALILIVIIALYGTLFFAMVSSYT